MIKKIVIPQLLIALSLALAIGAAAQDPKTTAPVRWERYQDAEKIISVFFPKMPVRIQSLDVCDEIETNDYVVYAEQAVYEMRIASKYFGERRAFCDRRRNFGENLLLERMGELKARSGSSEVTKSVQDGREVAKIKPNVETRWIFNDLKNDRWVELSIARRADDAAAEERFVKSLELTKNFGGITIGAGAPQTLGDETDKNQTGRDQDVMKDQNAAPPGAEAVDALQICAKPRANYTEQARQKMTQGTVMLRVIFLANGGIGSVSVFRELPDGLTEEAIAAARKIVFLPPRRAEKNVTVTKLIQYSFTIY